MFKGCLFGVLGFVALSSVAVTSDAVAGERIMICKSKSCPTPHNIKLRPFHPGPGCGYFPYTKVLSGNRISISAVKGCR